MQIGCILTLNLKSDVIEHRAVMSGFSKSKGKEQYPFQITKVSISILKYKKENAN